MTRFHAVTQTLSSSEVQSSTNAAILPASAPTRVIEVGGITAGIAVPDHKGVRFYSSERIFDGLDGVLFGSVEQATRAARNCSRRPARRSPPRLVVI